MSSSGTSHSTQASSSNTDGKKKVKNPKINRELTVKVVIENIVNCFPTMSNLEVSGFLMKSRKYIEKQISNNNLQLKINESSRTVCTFCPDSTLEIWGFKAKQSYLLSLGHIARIDIPVKLCRKCKRIFYPELYSKGVFPLHNRFLITIDFLMDFKNLLVMGTSTIEAIKQRIRLLSFCEGFTEHFEVNLINHCKDIEMACVGITALLITPSDMDSVMCLICGNCPKIVNSDGNAKVSIQNIKMKESFTFLGEGSKKN